MPLRPEQPGPSSYTPRSSSNIQFTHTWKAFRVHQTYMPSEFPFDFDLGDDGRYRVHFGEFRSLSDPPNDIGNPGDIWLNISSDSYTLFTLDASRRWVKWPGYTLDKTHMVFHPHLPLYALWCTIERASWYHCEKLADDLTGGKLEARLKLAGCTSLESMSDDPSMGVRLLLLREQMPKEKKSTANGMDSLVQMLSDMPQTPEAIIKTYAAVVEFFMVERQQILQVLSSTEARAESAERQVKETQEQLACLEKDTEVTTARAVVAERKLEEAEKKMAELETMSRIGIGPRHLELLFLGESSGHSWHCRICLSLITKPALLVAHAEQTHPTECALLVAASESQIDEARRQLVGLPS